MTDIHKPKHILLDVVAGKIFTIATLTSILFGCSSKQTWPPSEVTLKRMQSHYDAALADATNSIPYAADFVRLFPGAKSFLSYYTGVAGPSSLNTEIYLFDRYQLVMKIPVTFNQERDKIRGFGDPEFRLLEILKIGRAPNGNLSIQYVAAGQRSFGAGDWKRVVAAGGNFSAIGYTCITNSPVPGLADLGKHEEMHMEKPR